MASRNEVWCTCGHCQWTWMIYAKLPAPVDVVAAAMLNARCPRCNTQPPKRFMATEADIGKALGVA